MCLVDKRPFCWRTGRPVNEPGAKLQCEHCGAKCFTVVVMVTDAKESMCAGLACARGLLDLQDHHRIAPERVRIHVRDRAADQMAQEVAAGKRPENLREFRWHSVTLARQVVGREKDVVVLARAIERVWREEAKGE